MEEKPIHARPSLYAFYFEFIKHIGLKYGYNIVLHGSMNRDLDLIAIPWQEDILSHEEMIKEISNSIGGHILMQERSKEDPIGKIYSNKPHNRIVYLININRDFQFEFNGLVSKVKDYSDPQYYIDISVIQTTKTAMKSKTSNKILTETTEETKVKVIDYAKQLVLNKKA